MGENNGQLNGLRERTVELEAKMREKQQMRRKLMQQLEQLMVQLNVGFLNLNKLIYFRLPQLDLLLAQLLVPNGQ